MLSKNEFWVGERENMQQNKVFFKGFIGKGIKYIGEKLRFYIEKYVGRKSVFNFHFGKWKSYFYTSSPNRILHT